MTSSWTNIHVSFVITVLVLVAPLSARAQVSVLGKGWLLESTGSITSAPGEKITGDASIKGSASGPDTGIAKPFLNSDPAFIRFTPFETYTITFSYRVVAAVSGDFGFGFFSPTAQREGRFLPTAVIAGTAGASGTAMLTSTLESYPDVHVGFSVNGVGTILIDDLRITNGAGHVLVSENAEGPTIVPGLLGFQLTDAMTIVPQGGAVVLTLTPADLDDDGYPETILTLTDPTAFSTTSLQPIVVAAKGTMKLTTETVFPTGAPTTKNAPVTLFTDINEDGLPDIVFAEGQYDGPYTGPRTGPGLGVALNLGGGRFRNLQPLIPADQQTNRSYSLVAGDILGDGRAYILLSDEDDGSNTALLRWNGTGFDQEKNWIAPSLWKAPGNLVRHDWLTLEDFDRDGRQDLLVGGAPPPCTPNLQMLFGGPGGFASSGLVQLPDGLFGQGPCASTSPIAHNASVGPVVVADFNNDGLPDIFAAAEEVLTYHPGVITDTNEPAYAEISANGGMIFADTGVQVLLNQGSRGLVDVTSSSVRRLGRRKYASLITADLNNDGFVDVVGPYFTKLYAGVPPRWGTTLFLNDGTGVFQVIDGADLLAATTTTPSNGQQWNLGAFVPTVVTPGRTEGIFVESVGGCGVGFCAAVRLNLYKVVANKAIGTGPNFVDPETLGVPAFNEFYYVRHYADAAAAVAAGQYKSGLEHYVAVGAAKGYRPHAVICAAASCSLPFGAIDTPVEAAAGLSGSIAIGGWALSPSGITAVRILRAPVAGEGTQPVPVGTAVRLSGARPDVAAAYPTYLGKERAGWGYLLLTNVLPNKGNGTYTFYVYADDADGRSALIGTRTITADNAAATKPFGAIDTPAQGEIVSGTYVNFGWVLTPTPKVIPKDGSTITVYVDGVPLGHPTYDQYRADIAGLFPGLPNANGAVGAFVIDTTKLANGLHTISWLVTDSAGVSEGIGSRFFTVNNPR